MSTETESNPSETQPWTIAAHSLSYDEVSLMDLNVADIEKLVQQACITYADDQIGALHAVVRARDKALEERDEARREIERLQSEVRELRDVIRRGAAESVERA